MKTTEYPEDDTRTAPFAVAKKETAPGIDLPAPAAEAGATRNIALGVVCLLVAGIALWMGMYFDRSAAIVSIIVSLGSFGLLWLLANSRVLRQRHGIFFALALVVCFGALVPFVVGGLKRLDSIARAGIAGEPEASVVVSKPPPVPTRETAPPPPATPEEDEPVVAAKLPPKAPATPVDDGIIREFLAPALDAGETKVIEITEDRVLNVDGRKWKAAKGQKFKYTSLEDGIVTFDGGGQMAAIDSEYVRFTGKSAETPDKITQMAQFEAVRRYPKIGERDSPENNIYVVTTKEMQADPAMQQVLFSDPKWPLIIAEQLAVKHGWKRADVPAADETAPVPPPPADGGKAEPSGETEKALNEDPKEIGSKRLPPNPATEKAPGVGDAPGQVAPPAPPVPPVPPLKEKP